MKRTRIAILTIGQELLNGKVTDTNTAYAAQRLHDVGAELALAITIPDSAEVIAETLQWLKGKYDFVITSGGLGSTHNDVTMAGLAKYLGQDVIRHPYLKTIVGRFCETTDLTASQLRLADIPEGAQLIVEDDMHMPQIFVENIYVFPGIPEMFRMRLDRVLDRFKSEPFYQGEIILKGLELKFTPILNRAVKLHSEVEFGSYPSVIPESGEVTDKPVDQKIRITLESDAQDKIDAAKQFLLQNIPEGIELVQG